MPQRYDSRAASSSDCTSCSTCGSSSCPPRVASCSTCCAAGSWWVATHAASSLGVDTAKPQALACADARRWHHGRTAPHGDMAAQAVSLSLERGATQSPGVPSCAATKRPPSNPRHATRRRPRRRADRSAERPPCPWPSRRTRQGRWIVCSVSLGDVLTKHHEKSSSHEKRNR